MIKEAAQKLYDRKDITKDEFDTLCQLEKEAGIFSPLKEAIKSPSGLTPGIELAGKIGLGIGGASVIGQTLKSLYDAIQRKSAINHAYNTMQEKVPLLKDYPQDKIKDYFDVIKAFSPRSATNPLVAGALVHKMLEFGGVDHKLVQDISKIEDSAPSGFFYDIAKNTAGSFSQMPKPYHPK